MPFSQQDTEHIRAALHSALASPALTEWQRSFLGDMLARFAKYGTRTQLTEKQYAKLKQVLAPFEGSSPPVKPLASNPRPSPIQAKPQPVVRYPTRSRPPSPLRAIRKARRTARDMFWVLAVVVGGVVAVAGMFNASIPTNPGPMVSTTSADAPQAYSDRDFSITDGDTVQLHGADKGTRLVGFNTPETYEPRCSDELTIGRQATSRLKDLVNAAKQVELHLVACACRPGTEGTSECNFGRSCGALTVDDRDVGEILISEGLAVPFQCGRTSCPPLPRPWCG